MPKGCGCAGQSCGCGITAGAGITISGNGSVTSPFKIDLNLSAVPIKRSISASNSTTIATTLTGEGTATDPVTIQSSLALKSSDGQTWSIAVSTAGALSAVKI